jgi:hypothetical protein
LICCSCILKAERHHMVFIYLLLGPLVYFTLVGPEHHWRYIIDGLYCVLITLMKNMIYEPTRF